MTNRKIINKVKNKKPKWKSNIKNKSITLVLKLTNYKGLINKVRIKTQDWFNK